MPSDEQYMLRCLELAAKGSGFVSPNPLVGAVLVHNQKIIGEGFHQQYGQAHAEVNCLKSVPGNLQSLIPDSTLYVSLEPCSHYGKTPPCADLIIQSGIKKVVVGSKDPNHLVAGRGISKMKDAGIDVTVNILVKECTALNKRFFCVHQKSRPYIILKWAESADGFIAGRSGTPVKISEWPQQIAVHKQRFEEDAILVGYNTAFNDNPKISNRYSHTDKQPLRLLIDFENSLPAHYHLKDNSQSTIIFNYLEEKTDGNIHWIKINKGKELSTEIIAHLPKINSIVVEGGTKTLQTFIDSGNWDEIHLWKSKTMSIGEGLRAPELKNAILVSEKDFGNDRLLQFNPQSL